MQVVNVHVHVVVVAAAAADRFLLGPPLGPLRIARALVRRDRLRASDVALLERERGAAPAHAVVVDDPGAPAPLERAYEAVRARGAVARAAERSEEVEERRRARAEAGVGVGGNV